MIRPRPLGLSVAVAVCGQLPADPRIRHQAGLVCVRDRSAGFCPLLFHLREGHSQPVRLQVTVNARCRFRELHTLPTLPNALALANGMDSSIDTDSDGWTGTRLGVRPTDPPTVRPADRALSAMNCNVAYIGY
jgi:hypothetical protein